MESRRNSGFSNNYWKWNRNREEETIRDANGFLMIENPKDFRKLTDLWTNPAKHNQPTPDTPNQIKPTNFNTSPLKKDAKHPKTNSPNQPNEEAKLNNKDHSPNRETDQSQSQEILKEETKLSDQSCEGKVHMFGNFEDMKKRMLENGRNQTKDKSVIRRGKVSVNKRGRARQQNLNNAVPENDDDDDKKKNTQDSKILLRKISISHHPEHILELNTRGVESANLEAGMEANLARKPAAKGKRSTAKGRSKQSSLTGKKRKKKKSERGTGGKPKRRGRRSKKNSSASSEDHHKNRSKSKQPNTRISKKEKSKPDFSQAPIFNQPMGRIGHISYPANRDHVDNSDIFNLKPNHQSNAQNGNHPSNQPNTKLLANATSPNKRMNLGLADHHESKILSLKRELALQRDASERFRKKAQDILRGQLITNEGHRRNETKRFLLAEKERLGDYVLQRDMTKTKEVWVDGVAMAEVKAELEKVRKVKEKRADFKKMLKKKKGAMITADEILAGQIQLKKDSSHLLIRK